MTICIYNNRTLYADRAGVAVSRPSFFIEVKKLFISKCSRVAIAVSGPTVVNYSEFQKSLSKLVAIIKSQDHLNKDIVIDKDILEFLKDRTALILTNKAAYVLNLNDELLKPLDLTLPCAIGSGYDYSMIALLAGKDTMEAMRLSSCVDPVSFLTDVDSIAMKELHD